MIATSSSSNPDHFTKYYYLSLSFKDHQQDLSNHRVYATGVERCSTRLIEPNTSTEMRLGVSFVISWEGRPVGCEQVGWPSWQVLHQAGNGCYWSSELMVLVEKVVNSG